MRQAHDPFGPGALEGAFAKIEHGAEDLPFQEGRSAGTDVVLRHLHRKKLAGRRESEPRNKCAAKKTVQSSDRTPWKEAKEERV